MGIYLYNNKYNGLPKDSIEYKKLRIQYLNKYLYAIQMDNIWMEKHYFQKLLTCIRYENFSKKIVDGLHKVFIQRADYIALLCAHRCEMIKNDKSFDNDMEKISYYLNEPYHFRVNQNQICEYTHNYHDDLKRIFELYKKNGFASDETVKQFKIGMNFIAHSQMEKEMMKYFNQNDIVYICQKTFNDLKSPKGSLLKFDGCIEKNGKILLFECQGIQHYQPVDFFGGEDAYKTQLEYDKLKREYCKKNNIPLLCIKYNQNVAAVIEKFLKRKNYGKIVYGSYN